MYKNRVAHKIIADKNETKHAIKLYDLYVCAHIRSERFYFF